MKRIHLLCNAHLDPMWQWEWEEGAAAAVSTFRCAAEFCEEFDTFVFNHNEALLYRWVEEYEPSLFKRIQKLVTEGKWHIIGGWYLQPDCNMLSGESLISQIQAGRDYFKEKFGVIPTTAINFDSFGHCRGLVQILKKAGYDSYIFLRPGNDALQLNSDEFIWCGYDDSEIVAHRMYGGYGTPLGNAVSKIKYFVDNTNLTDDTSSLLLWGVGNHGGGPSRQDIIAINNFKEELLNENIELIHSSPENYFAEIMNKSKSFEKKYISLRHSMQGCYISQVLIKQKHRELENLLAFVKKISSSACMNGVAEYPFEEIEEAGRDLMLAQFHDVLPGSSIQEVERKGLSVMEHGIELLSRVRARMFFALSKGQHKTPDNKIPILVYNPHPYTVKTTIECEFMLADQNWIENTVSIAIPYKDGVRITSQMEKEKSNLNLDWRKRLVFEAVLNPSSISRYDCDIELVTLPEDNLRWKSSMYSPSQDLNNETDSYILNNKNMNFEISRKTGLVTKYAVDGLSILSSPAGQLRIFNDYADPWGMNGINNSEVDGDFEIANAPDTKRICDTTRDIESVRIIEDGDLRTVIECIFVYKTSSAVVKWFVPKNGVDLDVSIRVFNNEIGKMIKFMLPVAFNNNLKYYGQDAFGMAELDASGSEQVSLQWIAVANEESALTIINDGLYASYMKDGVIGCTLLRSPAYTAHPIGNRSLIPTDRFSPRIDVGERLFNFKIQGGNASERFAKINREAMAYNEKPFALSFFPSGEDEIMPKEVIEIISDNNCPVVMSALQKAKHNNGYIVRLFNPDKIDWSLSVKMPLLGIDAAITIPSFQVITYLAQYEIFTETSMIEG